MRLLTFAIFLPVVLSCSQPNGQGRAGKRADELGAKPGPPASAKAPTTAAKSEKPAKVTSASSNPTAVGGSHGWSTFRGDPQRTGRADVAGPRTARLKWVFRTRGRVYADASVSPDGETIYVASHDGNLYAVDTDGVKKWAYDAGGKIWTSPSIARDGTIYFGSDSDLLFAVNREGRKVWDFVTTQAPVKGDKPEAGRYDVDTSPVLAADGSIIFGCHTNLFALRPLKGGLRWIFEAGVGKSKIFSSPALGHDGTIYFGTQGRFFFALNQSAKVLWNIKTKGDNDSSPAVGDDGTIYFGSDDGKLRAIAPGGNLRWEVDLGYPIRAPVAVGSDGTVFASTYGTEPFLAAIEPNKGEERWRFAVEPGAGSFYGIQSGALIDSEGHIYFGGRDHFVYCLSPSGELVWKYETGDQVDASPVLGPDGTLYIGSDDKRLYAFGR